MSKARKIAQYLWVAAAFGLCYYLGARLGQLLTFQSDNFTAMWFSSGILLAFLLCFPLGAWPYLIVAAFVANISFDVWLQNKPLWVSSLFTLANVMTAFLSCVMVKRRFPKGFNPAQSFTEFVHLMLLYPLCAIPGACLGTLALWAVFDNVVFRTWITWWCGDCLGMALITPLMIGLIRGMARLWRQSSWLGWTEFGAVFCVNILMVALCFNKNSHFFSHFPYLTAVAVLWAAVRLPGVPCLFITFVGGCIVGYFEARGMGILLQDPDLKAIDDLAVQWFLFLAAIGIGALTTTVFDLKEQKNRYKKLQEKAQRANAEKTSFLATMSHDIRTPLNAIIGFSDLGLQVCGENGGDPKFIKECFGHVAFAGRHLLNLVTGLLNVSAIEARKVDLDKQKLDLKTLIPEVMALHKSAALAKQVHLGMILNIEKPVYADSHSVVEILNNLLGNAIKFTPLHGSISVEVEEKDSFAAISVKDTGVGIDKDDFATIFSPFSQGKKSTQSHVEGGSVGLGLAIAKKLVELHGSKLSVVSARGEGSCFSFALPVMGNNGESAQT